MIKFTKYSVFSVPVFVLLLLLSSCSDFLDPQQELNVNEDMLFDDWYEYRSVEMGLYGLQQDLVEQLVVLGELRADLLTITPNADADLVEIYNFNFNEGNKYASPIKFFKLISASNNFIRVLEREHPEVLDSESAVTNYDKLYGEALCMRAWAYFNAVRIYGKVPYIEESLVTMEEIQNFVNTPGTYIDSVYIDFAVDGYYNDTIYNHPITLEKNLYDMEMVLDKFIYQLENDVKAVGVNHYIDNNDNTWEITIWNTWAWHNLLGNLYLYQGDLEKAAYHYEEIVYNSTEDLRYQLDNSFANNNWGNIFTGIDNKEHIFTLWFNKSNFQQNDFQKLFEPFTPHNYMLKPTRQAIMNWETEWRGTVINENNSNPDLSRVVYPGRPSDFYRGYGSSYLYTKGNGLTEDNFLSSDDYLLMLENKAEEDYRSVNAIMDGYDTIVYKFSIGKTRFSQDANFAIYRAAAVHLNLAEVYTHWVFEKDGNPTTFPLNAVNIVNDGSNYTIVAGRPQLGVRGRVGLGSGNAAIQIKNIIYDHDPFTNEILGYRDLTGNLYAKQLLLDEELLGERARELAFEGERFYDLMRIAKRRGDPAFLAEKVSQKYPSGKREQIYNLLMDENNWYINFFE